MLTATHIVEGVSVTPALKEIRKNDASLGLQGWSHSYYSAKDYFHHLVCATAARLSWTQGTQRLWPIKRAALAPTFCLGAVQDTPSTNTELASSSCTNKMAPG